MNTADTNLERAQRYLDAVSRQAVGEELAAFYDPDVIQEELPNRLNPSGTTRSLKELLQGAERGRAVMSTQTWRTLRSVAEGDTVALEVEWTGTLAIPLGALKAGDVMKARFALFLEYRNGKIFRQRNYDCFEPW